MCTADVQSLVAADEPPKPFETTFNHWVHTRALLVAIFTRSTQSLTRTTHSLTIKVQLLMTKLASSLGPTRLFPASTSSTSSLTNSPSHHINSVLTPLCPLARPSGYSSKFTHIWCTFEMLTVNCFRQTNSPCLQPPFRHSSMVRLEFGSLLEIDGSQHIQMTTK